MNAFHHTIVGLPRSGKTTFLAALYHLVDSGEVSTKLRIDSYSGDQTYLNQIVSTWLACKEVIRTSGAENTRVELRLREEDSSRTISLVFPDLAGEIFETQVAERKCQTDYVDGCNQRGGILLFVSANRQVGEDMTVIQQNALFGQPSAEQAATGPAPSEWSAAKLPSQVQLIELLQFLLHPPFLRRKRRLAVIVSAWDVVHEPKPSPSEWLERELPLLSQFLVSNPQAFETRIYGVSALGGDISNEGSRDLLMDMTHSKRIVCTGPDCDEHDLTSPILWLCAEE